MTTQVEIGRIVEDGAPEPAIVEQEAARLYQIDRDAEARGEPQHRAGILRNVGLEEGDPQATSIADVFAPPDTGSPAQSLLNFPPIYAAVCHIVRVPQPYSLPRRPKVAES